MRAGVDGNLVFAALQCCIELCLLLLHCRTECAVVSSVIIGPPLSTCSPPLWNGHPACCRFEDLGPVLCAALDGLRLPSFPQVGSRLGPAAGAKPGCTSAGSCTCAAQKVLVAG